MTGSDSRRLDHRVRAVDAVQRQRTQSSEFVGNPGLLHDAIGGVSGVTVKRHHHCDGTIFPEFVRALPGPVVNEMVLF